MAGENLALISGFGGIGKTAIARALYHELEKEYDHMAWIDYKENLKQSILNDFKVYLDDKDQASRWNKIELFLTNCQKKLLIFVDNITQEEDSDLPWLTGLNAHVVITSRLSEILGFEKYEIDFLNKKQGIEVFYCYYKHDEKREQEKVVSQLVDLVSCHTLSIELLAGNANGTAYSGGMLKQFLQDLQEKGFGFPDLKTKTSHEKDKKLTISEHLVKLFEIVQLSDEQLRILANFQILKGTQVPREFSVWIESETNAREHLVNSRWISFSENRYLMHDIVWEAVTLQLKELFPDGIPYEYAEKMIKTIVSGGYFNYKDEHTVSTTKIKIAEAYATYFSDIKTEEWGVFLNLFGIRYYNLEKYKEALACQEKVLGIKKMILEKNHPDIATTYNNFALVYIRTGEYDKAQEYNEKALDIREKVLEKEHPDTAITYNNIGRVYRAIGEYDKAFRYFQKALDIKEKVLGENHSSTAMTYSHIARVYQSKGECDKALEYFQKTSDIKEKVFDKDHSSRSITYNDMALLYQTKGEYDKALEYFQKTSDIKEKAFEEGHPSRTITYNDIALLYQAKEEYDKALKYFQKTLGKDHPSRTITYNDIALLYQDKGEYDKALKYYEMNLTIFEKALGKDHLSTATIYNNIALVYQDKREYDTALTYYKTALGIIEKILRKEHPVYQTIKENLESLQNRKQ